jgi:tetratricopeptide (TPR) repeat protein
MTANNIESGFWTRRFPQFYDELKGGDYRTAGNWLRNFRRRSIGNAMSFAMIGATACSDARRAQAERESNSAVLSDFGISTIRQKDICMSWGNLDLGSEYREPVRSNIKTLIIGGTLDGVTPMSNAEAIHDRFSNSTLIKVINAAHDELINSESTKQIRRFLLDLNLETTSIQRPFYFFPIKAHKYSLHDSLYTVITAHGVERTLSVYRHLYRDYGSSGDYVFEFEEYELNSLGYTLMGEKKYEEAAAIFALNIRMNPELSKVYDSHAEALTALLRTNESIESYKKSLQLDFLNNNADQRLRELGVDIPY